MTKRFKELVAEILALHEAKNSDYNAEPEKLKNFFEAEDFGIPAWKCVLAGRMTDKWNRIKTLSIKKEPSVKDEKLVDTLRDLAVYSLICIELLERSEQNDMVK